jgi:hypothetical protein
LASFGVNNNCKSEKKRMEQILPGARGREEGAQIM